MKPGDLVKLKEGSLLGAAYGEELRDRPGVIIEWNEGPGPRAMKSPAFYDEGFLSGYGDGWVQWAGIEGTSIVYEEDLEIVK